MDPGQPRTLDEFIGQLRALKVWAGNPSITQLTKAVGQAWRRAGRPESELPARATVGYCFRTGRSRPNPDLLLAIVAVLTGDDPDLVDRWRQALLVVLGEAEAASQVSVADLPADLADFTGRAELLDRAGGGDDPLVISALDGMAGVGKTALAVRLAHRLVDRGAVDRVLFVNLRGYDPDSPPANPGAVLESFLRRLGVPGERIPPAPDRRAALYRDVLRGTRTLVVLDNAGGAEQVRPLLPGVPGCPVLITSRVALADLAGARLLRLPPFTPAEALDLLRRIAGAARIDADQATAARIAELLGHLPLALAVIGSHLRDHPDWALADYPPALTALAMEGGVRAALALSDAGLAAPLRRLLRLLALHPGVDIDRYAAAALADADLATTAAQLATLAGANLLQEKTPGRYDFHDLTRAYATERATLDHPRSHLESALDRLFDHFGRTASLAMDVAYGYEASQRPPAPRSVTPSPIGPPAAGPAAADAAVPDAAAPDAAVPEAAVPDPAVPEAATPATASAGAEAWLDAELDNLLAAAAQAPEHGRPDHTRHQSATLHRHLRTRGRYADALALHERALALARAGADRRAEQAVRSLLGDVHYMQGRYDEAAGSYQQALATAREIGDLPGEQNACNGLGAVQYMQGRYEPAAQSYQRALALSRELGDRTGEQNALNGLGWVHHVQGRRQLAIDYYEQGLAIARATGNPNGEQNALNGLGGVHQAEGRHDQAAACYQQVLRSARATGNRLGEQNALTGLGHSRYAQRRYPEAADLFGQVLRIAQATGNRIGEALALTGLGHVLYRQGRYAEAAGQYEQALVIAAGSGYRNAEYEAHTGLGHCHTAAGDYDAALRCHRTALDLATDLGQPDDQARAHDGLAHAYQARGEPEPARAHWQQALDIMVAHELDHTYDPQVTAAAIRARLAG